MILAAFLARITEWFPRGGAPAGRSRLRIALLLFLAAHLVSTICSIEPWLSIWGTIFRQQGLLTLAAYVLIFVAIWSGVETRRQWERVVTALILASAPVCVYAIAQRLGLDPLIWEIGSQRRVSSTMGNPIFLGAYVAMIFFPTLARLCQSLGTGFDRQVSSDWLAASYGMILLLQLAALWFTRSRGPLLACAAGAVAFGVCMYRQGALPRATLRHLLAIMLLLLIGLCAGVLLTLALGIPGATIEPLYTLRTIMAWIALGVLAAIALRLVARWPRRLWPLPVFAAAMVLLFTSALGVRVEPSRGPGLQGIEGGLMRGTWEQATRTVARASSARERILYWEGYLSAYTSPRAFSYVPANPGEQAPLDRLHPIRFLIGTGPETGGEVFQQHYPRELRGRHTLGTTADRAHNEVWDHLATTGLLGLATYLWLLTQLFSAALQASGFAMVRRERRALLVELCGGGVVGGILATVAAGPHLLGVGGQIGVSLGAFVHLVRGRLRAGPINGTGLMPCALLAGLLCHLVEGTVGFGVAATRFQFWVFAGLLVVAAAHRRWSRAPSPDTHGNGEAAILGVLAGVAIGGMAYSLLGQEPVLQILPGEADPVFGLPQATRLLALPMSLVAGDAGQSSGFILVYIGLLFLPWIWAVTHLGWGQEYPRSAPPPLKTFGVIALVSGGVIALAWLSVSEHHLHLPVISITGRTLADLCTQVLEQTRYQTGRALLLYLWWGTSLGLLALLLRRQSAVSVYSRRSRIVALLSAPLVLFAVWQISLRPVQADILSRAGLRWRGTPPAQNAIVSVALLREAVRTAPEYPSLWFNLAEAASTAAAVRSGAAPAVECDWEDFADIPARSLASLSRPQLLGLARAAIARTRTLQPANPLVALNFSRLYAREATLSEDPAARRRATELAEAWQALAQDTLGMGSDSKDAPDLRGSPGPP